MRPTVSVLTRMPTGRHRPTRRLLSLVLVGVLTGGATALVASPRAEAAPTDGPDMEMPFPCADTWNGRTFARHSPSIRAIDWNRTDDLGAPTVASAPGVVTTAADLGDRSYGKYVVVDHGGGWTTLYAHLSEIWATKGQAVDQGTILGLVGSSGGSTGPHLHFEERRNRLDQVPYFDRRTFAMGTTQASTNCGDTPVVGDWDGNRTANIGVMRRSASAEFILKRPGKAATRISYGLPTDQPISGDWNGDGVIDVGVRRPGLRSFLLRAADGTTTRVALGRVSDLAVTGDWDGDRRTDLGVWHPSTRRFTLRTSTGRLSTVVLGVLGDRPVAGDWNGDGMTDLGVYTSRTGTFTLRSVARDGAVTTTSVAFGDPNSLPLAGDWNADGRTDIGVWDPTSAQFSRRLSPSTLGFSAVVRTNTWGLPRG